MGKRERYESANMRGGLGVRKRLSEDSFKTTYRLNGVQRGATIAECLDRYGRWEGGYRLGVLVRKTAHYVYIKWDDEDEVAMIDHGDARYNVDRERWKVTNPRIGDPLGGERGIALQVLADTKVLENNNAGPALTEEEPECENEASANAADSTDRGDEQLMADSNAAREREDAQRALKNGDLKDRETYTAKQVAYRCGTDSKTMRKFFRSKASTVTPVGQGGRYEFDARDLPKIQKEFAAWRKTAESRKPAPKVEPEPKLVAKVTFVPTDGDHDEPTPKSNMTMDELADAIERIQDEEEPTPEQLKELELMEEARDAFADFDDELMED